MRSEKSKWMLTAAFALIAGIALFHAFAQVRKDPPDQDDEEEEALRAPSHVVVRNGETIIRLGAAEQLRSGIETASLTPTREQREVAAPAMVLDAQDLVNLTASYASALANLRKAENNLSVSQREYGRLKALYTNQQNVSAKDFQAAEGIFRNDQMDVRTARQNLEFQMAALRQSWGDEIAKEAASGSVAIERILNRQDMLVQVTLPADGPAMTPAMVSLELPNQRSVVAKRVSRFPRVDPRIQGASYLYVTRAQGPLEPGLNLIADFATGPRLAGVVIPSSSIVWWNGKSWVYVEAASNEFVRRAVATNFPVAEGFFVSQGVSPGARIVRGGAQALLSEEFRPQIQPEE